MEVSRNGQIQKILFDILIAKISQERGTEYFFENIIGCSEEFLDYVKGRQGEQCGIFVRMLRRASEEDGAFDIIRLRNDARIKKCVIFANCSVKDIDSLKDVREREISELVDSQTVDQMIRRQDLSIRKDGKYGRFIGFLGDLISCVSPGVPELLEYIKKVEEFYKTKTEGLGERKLAWAANRNLYTFSMWSSASLEFLRKGKINKIYMASKPTNIHKRLSSISQISALNQGSSKPKSEERLETRGFAPANQRKKILTNMICDQTYQESFERIYYEYVESLIGRKKRGEGGSKTESEQKEELDYLDKYMIASGFLCESEEKIDEKALDEKEADEIQRIEDGVFILPLKAGKAYEYKIQYDQDMAEKKKQELQKKFRWEPEQEDADKRRKQYLEYLTEIENRCDDLNIPYEDRNAIKEKIRTFRSVWILLKHSEKTPEFMQAYLRDTDRVCSAFYDLARYIMTMKTEARQAVAGSGILEGIVNIDMKIENGNLYVPCYNPLMIFYLRQINNRNRSLFEYFNEERKDPDRAVYDYQLRFLEEFNRVVPNDIIWYKKKKYMYVRDNRKARFPYYLRYKDMATIASLETVSLLHTLKYIESFRTNNFYKNDIRFCLVGDIYLDSARLYIRRLENLIKREELEKVVIEIVTKTSDSIKSVLEGILDTRQGERSGIEIKIQNLNSEDYMNFRMKDYLERNDLVFLLDPSFMYHSPRYVTGQPNNMRNLIRHQSLEREEGYLGIPEERTVFSAAVIPDIINCFQNAQLETELTPGIWEKYSLNTRPIIDIFEVLRNQRDHYKTVVFISSDEKIDTKLDNDQFLKSISEGKSGNKTLKIIEWKSDHETAASRAEQKGCGYIEVKMADILNAFPSAGIPVSQLPDVSIRIYYETFPEEIQVRAYCKDSGSETEETEDQVRQVIRQYLTDVIKSDFWLIRMLRENLYQILWNEAESLEELMFVYALKKCGVISISYEYENGTGEQKEKSSPVSGPRRRTLNNNILQLLDIAEKEKINYRMTEQLDGFMKKNHHSIDREDCLFMADTLERFDKERAVLYTADNIREYVKRKWGE